MARRTFFSFHYKYVWKVNQIRNMINIIGTSAAGFQDSSLWEAAKIQGDKEIKRIIDDALKLTTVTVVCVSYGAANRKYINAETYVDNMTDASLYDRLLCGHEGKSGDCSELLRK